MTIADRQPRGRPGRSPSRLAALTLLATYLLMTGWYLLSDEPGPLFATNALAFVVAAVNLAVTRDYFHPFTMIPFIHGMYAVLPLASSGNHWDEINRNSLMTVFGAEGGAIVFSSATLGILIAWCIFGPYSQTIGRDPGGEKHYPIPKRAAPLVLCAGAALLALFFAKVGLGQFAGSGYQERFQQRLAPGMGALINGGIALTSLGLALCLAGRRINVRWATVAVLLLMAMFLVTGERKHLILPILMCAAAFQNRVRRIPIATTAVLCAALYLSFEYIGYVRVMSNGGLRLDAAVSIPEFGRYLGDHIGGGELASIYGTASAAYQGFIEPLPALGDYLGAWKMAVPQFLMESGYASADYRFAATFDPSRALYDRMGWGFSFFGEAYLVLGIVGPAMMAIAVCALGSHLYREARSSRFQGVSAAIWFSWIYFQIWAQRNPVAHLIKDWGVYQVVAFTLLRYASSRVSLRSGLPAAAEMAARRGR